MAGNIDLTPEAGAALNAAESGAKVAGDIIGNATETAINVAESGAKAAGDIIENVAVSAVNVAETGAKVAGDIIENAAETALNVAESAAETAIAVGEKAIDLVENAADLAGDVVDKVADIGGDILDIGMSALETGADIIGTALKFTPAGAAINLVSGLFGGDDGPAEGSNLKPVSTYSYYLPGIGGEVDTNENGVFQSNPLLNTYSPRLFGAPHQLTHLNDMRLLSSKNDEPGPVGDFYLEKILTNAEICNIVVGRAVFTGGMNGLVSGVRNLIQYASAMKKYGDYIFANTKDGRNQITGGQNVDLSNANLSTYKKILEAEGESKDLPIQSETDEYGNKYSVSGNTDSEEVGGMLDSLENWLNGIDRDFGALRTALKTSWSVQQPFYSFDSDWGTYIQRVKFMINAFATMLGVSNASVRIGDKMMKIGVEGQYKAETDVWANYRYITPTKENELGSVTAIDTQNGDTSQYVSFMIDPSGSSESYTNAVGESQIYSSVINQGSSIGNEIAFLTNSSQSAIDDAIIGIASKSINAAEAVLSGLGGGLGRFTASVAGSLAKSYVGDHTIYPQIFQSHTSTTSKSITIHLSASGGDPYSYLTDICVPLSFVLPLVLPDMSRNTASAYSYPPVVQLNIPGLWGTRLGMVTQVDITKNPSGKDFSIHGYPLSVDINMTVTDLQHVLVATGMDKPAMFLNNNTMFDYIAQCAGVDKYRVNGSMRLITKLTLGMSALSAKGIFANIGNALHTDLNHLANKIKKTYAI